MRSGRAHCRSLARRGAPERPAGKALQTPSQAPPSETARNVKVSESSAPLRGGAGSWWCVRQTAGSRFRRPRRAAHASSTLVCERQDKRPPGRPRSRAVAAPRGTARGDHAAAPGTCRAHGGRMAHGGAHGAWRMAGALAGPSQDADVGVPDAAATALEGSVRRQRAIESAAVRPAPPGAQRRGSAAGESTRRVRQGRSH